MGGADSVRMPTPSSRGSTSNEDKASLGLWTTSESISTSSTNPHTPKRQIIHASEDQIGYKMSLRGVTQNDEAYECEATFKEFIEDIVLSKRKSAMRDVSAKKFRYMLDIYEKDNEATFMHHIVGCLRGEGYHVLMDREDQELWAMRAVNGKRF